MACSFLNYGTFENIGSTVQAEAAFSLYVGGRYSTNIISMGTLMAIAELGNSAPPPKSPLADQFKLLMPTYDKTPHYLRHGFPWRDQQSRTRAHSIFSSWRATSTSKHREASLVKL